MLRAGVSHSGSTPTFAHSPMGLGPRRQSVFALFPMDHRCLITPVEKIWHGCSVRSRCHIASHTLLTVPRRHGPKGPATIGQDRPFVKSLRLADLSACLEKMHRKGW